MDFKILKIKNNSKNGAVIWLHGLGANAYDFYSVPSLFTQTKNLDYYFPNAPIQPVSINANAPMPSWYNIYSLSMEENSIDQKGLQRISKDIHSLIYDIIESGISSKNITLIGFSQGGSVALHAGLSFPEKLCSIIGLSTYLGNPSIKSYQEEKNKNTHILLLHGSHDPVINLSVAKFTHSQLAKHNYKVTFETENIQHNISPSQINRIDRWLSSQHSL